MILNYRPQLDAAIGGSDSPRGGSNPWNFMRTNQDFLVFGLMDALLDS